MLIMYEAVESCRFVINLSYSFYQIYAQNQVNFGQRLQNRHAIVDVPALYHTLPCTYSRCQKRESRPRTAYKPSPNDP
jgi:hypothetical protein